MADYQRVVEFLRDLQGGPLAPPTDDVRQCATEYAELCRQANERLRQCTTYLQQGLRSEALHMASELPNLLDLVAALDLPDPSGWADHCQQWEMPTPPPLQMDRAAQLSEAYGADASIEHLLDEHRLLALSRGPIRRRLEVMRLIAQQDPASSFWERDIRVFEKARFKELRLAVTAAAKNRDQSAIADLAGEVEQSAWFEPMPDDIRKAVGDSFQSMLKTEVEHNLKGVMTELRKAYAARDHAQCTSLLAQARQMLDAAGLDSVATPIAVELQPIVAYVSRENELHAQREKFRRACAGLGSLLDAPLAIKPEQAQADEAALKDAYRKLQAFDDHEIPDELTARFEQRLAALASAQWRRQVKRIALWGTAVAALLACGFIFFEYQNAIGWSRRIHDANAAKNLPEARRLIADQEQRAGRLSAVPALGRAKAETTKLAAQFDAAAATVKEASDRAAGIADEIDVALANPSAAAERLRAHVDRANWALEQLHLADDSAWADPDRVMASLRERLEADRVRLNSEAKQRIGSDVSALADQVEGVNLADPAAIEGLERLAARVENVKALSWLDADARARLQRSANLIAQKRARITATRDLATQLAALRSGVYTAESLATALSGFVQGFGDNIHASGFAAAIDRLQYARAVETWAALVAQWQTFGVTTAVAATQRAASVDQYLKGNPASPFAPDATTYAEYCKAAADGLSEKNTWSAGLSDLLASPMISDLSYMETAEGKRYYTLGDIQRTDKTTSGKITTSFQAIDPSNLAKRVTITVTAPNKVTTTQPVRAPHARLAAELADSLRLIDETSYETWGMDAADRIVHDNASDLIVRTGLLTQVLKSNQTITGWAIGGLYEKPLAALNRLGVDNLPWYDPDRPQVEGTRLAINRATALLPDPKDAKQQLAARRAQIFNRLTFRYVATGLLLKDDSGQWTIAMQTPPQDGATAIVVMPPAPPNPYSTLLPISSAAGSKFNLTKLPAGLPEGTFVFITAP